MTMREQYRGKLAHKATATRLLDGMFINPYVSVRRATQLLDCTAPTAMKAIGELEREGVIAEATGRQWGRVYIAREILEILQAPLPT